MAPPQQVRRDVGASGHHGGMSTPRFPVAAFLESDEPLAVVPLAEAEEAAAGARIADWAVALGAVLVELAGVVGVGLWTALDPGMFAHDTVWSRFGAGYGYVPLALPVVGLIWLLTHRPARPAEAGAL